MDYNFLTENLRTREELAEYIESIIEEKQEKSDITTDGEYLDEDLNFLNKGVFWLIKDKYNNERLITYKYSFNSLEAIFDKHKYSHENVWKDFDCPGSTAIAESLPQTQETCRLGSGLTCSALLTVTRPRNRRQRSALMRQRRARSARARSSARHSCC